MWGQSVNDETDRMCKKSIMFYIKILRWHLLHLTEQNDETPQSDEPASGAEFETGTSVVRNIIWHLLTWILSSGMLCGLVFLQKFTNFSKKPLDCFYCVSIYTEDGDSWNTQAVVPPKRPRSTASLHGLTSKELWMLILYKFCLFLARQPPVGQGLLIQEVSRSHTMTHHSQ